MASAGLVLKNSSMRDRGAVLNTNVLLSAAILARQIAMDTTVAAHFISLPVEGLLGFRAMIHPSYGDSIL